MKHYRIFEHPAGNIEAVKLGWSWPAFFFPVIWALFKKMWWLGGCVFAFSFLAFLLPDEALYESAILDVIAVIEIVLRFIFGVNGNRWRENNLQSRGYDYKETRTAENPDGATALYLKQKSNAPVQPGVGRL